jgi:hypothetical protein
MSGDVGVPDDAGKGRKERDLDAVTGRVLAELLSQSHVMRPAALDEILTRIARPLSVSQARIYLPDLQYRYLSPLPDREHRDAEVLSIDSTLAGRAYQTMTVQPVPVHGAGDGGEAYRVWIPLLDGADRLGVLSLTVADVSETMLDRYRALASLAGIILVAKTPYSDTYAQVRRDREMTLQGELVWALLPPRTFATDRVLVSASLEPAYAVGGDAFDYSLLGDHLHVSVFDALGHDLSAGLLASVGIASCRSTRRSGGSLAAIAARADDAIATYFGDYQFVTALLCDLNVASGLLTWIPCGHPPPLLIRGNRTVKELTRTGRPPLGLAGLYAARGKGRHDGGAPDTLCTEKLQPGDRVLLYTDGVTEGRAADGTPFGPDRLADFIIRQSSANLPAPEMMRRLNHAIVKYQDGQLRDDATAVLIEWQPGHPGRDLTP